MLRVIGLQYRVGFPFRHKKVEEEDFALSSAEFEAIQLRGDASFTRDVLLVRISSTCPYRQLNWGVCCSLTGNAVHFGSHVRATSWFGMGESLALCIHPVR